LDRNQRRRASTGLASFFNCSASSPSCCTIAPIDRFKQGLAGWEVAVKRSDADTGPSCHGFETGVRATGTEDSLRGLQNALAIANRIGAGPPNRFCGSSCHLIILDHDLVRLNWIMISSPCLSMIFSQNQLRFFRITLRSSLVLINGGCLRICQ
jgi:hypothetical protein